MKFVRNGLTWLLAVALTITMIPVSFAGSAGNSQDITAECVMYNLLDMPVYVSSDAEMAQDAPEQYKLFDDDGNYTIKLEDNAFFPYEVLFAYQSSSDGEWVKTREWFDTPESTVEVAGHTFSVHSEMNDPDKISQFGVYVGDDYVAARPAEKEFSDNGGISLTSLQPLREVKLKLDLSEYLPPELTEVKLDTIFADCDITVKESDKVVWSKWSGWNNNYENDEFEIIDTDQEVNLSSSYNEKCTLEMIVGSADQLDTENIRYIVNLTVTPGDEWLEYDTYWRNADNESGKKSDYEIYEENKSISFRMTNSKKGYAYIYLDHVEDNSYFTTAIHFPNGKFDNRKNDIRIYYQGLNGKTDITANIWGKFDDSKTIYKEWLCENGYFKEDYNGNGKLHLVMETVDSDNNVTFTGNIYFLLNEEYIEPSVDGLFDSFGNEVFDGNSTVYINTGNRQVRYSESSTNPDGSISGGGGVYTVRSNMVTYILKPGYRSSDSYILRMSVDDESDVEGIYEGLYDSTKDAQAAGRENISVSVLENGYEANYDEGVNLSVIRKNHKGVYQFKVIAATKEEYQGPGYVEEDNNSTAVPETDYWDPYFRITGVKDKNGNNINDIYIVPYKHDTYYADGRQTILINDPDVDLTSLIPVFITGHNINVYAGENVNGQNTGAVRQISGQNVHNFENGPVLYSAAEEGTHLRNYYVTFVKKQSGKSSLFVNGTNDAKNGDDSVRKIYFNGVYGYYHDIFISNIGDKDISGLKVTLSNAKNIKLDDYWTVRDDSNGILGSFSKTDSSENEYGELSNMAKIRLLPTDDDGEIEGTLTIKADGQDPVNIKLTGKSGETDFVTESLAPGVKYVPYSSVIQSDNMFTWNRVSFYTTSDLPDGMKLYPNGELYGVPTEEGSWEIDIVMKSQSRYTADQKHKKFTLNIGTNSDSAVESATDENYQIIERIPDKEEYQDDELFWGNGALDELVGLWLDGEKLTEGADGDYIAESGSTKITVRSQTFSNISDGKHTIAMEYRTPNKQLKRTSQNFNKGKKQNGSGPSGGGGGGSAAASSTAYSISKGNVQNGTLKISPEKAEAGKTVTVTAIPNAGYETVSVTVKDSNGNNVNTVKNANGAYTFVMPKGRVTVSAEFRSIYISDIYNDVNTNDWFYPEVKWATEAGYMNGTGNKLFKPKSNISEAMLVQVLARMSDIDTSKYTSENYDDIESGKWYSDAAKWARAVGILGNERFSAIPPCERGKLAVMIVRYFDSQGINYAEPEGNIVIADKTKMSDEELRAFRILVNAGIFKGKGNNVMDPEGATTRAELTTLLHRIYDYTGLNKTA